MDEALMRICTLIPAYKIKYVEPLLLGLQSQTMKPYRIIFSDDSPGGVFTERLLSDELAPLRAGLAIEVMPGPRNGAFENFKHLVNAWGRESELFHILLDDDVVFPEFYERHLVAHLSGDFSCSISRRWESNEAGQPLSGQPVPPAVTNSVNRFLSLNADVAFMSTVAECKNWFGEFSNVVFRGDCSAVVLNPAIAGVSYAGLWDLGAFLAASLIRPICHIQDHLGYFRKGPDQNSAQTYSPIMKAAMLAYVALAISGRRIGKINGEQAMHCFATIANVLNYWYATQDDMVDFRAVLPRLALDMPGSEDEFLGCWQNFLATNGY